MISTPSIRAERSRGRVTVWPSSLYLALIGLPCVLRRAVVPMARPWVAGLVALAVYLLRGSLAPSGLGATNYAYFNYLADAFLHGQLGLRLPPGDHHDLIVYAGQTYLYWAPLPAILLMPLVALFGVMVSDVVYTAVAGAVSIALVARLLQALDRTGIAPLTVERRAILVTTCAFGSVYLILAPAGTIWFTAQIVGVAFVLLAAVAGLTVRGRLGYLLVGIGLACAMATRLPLLFNGVWLAYYLCRRDYRHPRQWPALAVWAVIPVALTLLLLGWYNAARFGSPFEVGLDWHNMSNAFRADHARYGLFSLHYLPRNLYYQFVAYNLFTPGQLHGSGLFWLTPVFLGAPLAVWQGRRSGLVWALVLTGLLVYVPIGLYMGTGFLTFGPRFLLDLLVPLLVLTALGIRRWRLGALQLLLLVSCASYALGSAFWWVFFTGTLP